MERATSLEGENLVATELEHLSFFGRKPEFSTVTQMAEARLAESNTGLGFQIKVSHRPPSKRSEIP